MLCSALLCSALLCSALLCSKERSSITHICQSLLLIMTSCLRAFLWEYFIIFQESILFLKPSKFHCVLLTICIIPEMTSPRPLRSGIFRSFLSENILCVDTKSLYRCIKIFMTSSWGMTRPEFECYQPSCSYMFYTNSPIRPPSYIFRYTRSGYSGRYFLTSEKFNPTCFTYFLSFYCVPCHCFHCIDPTQTSDQETATHFYSPP